MISVALIGCGDVAEHGHLPALSRHKRFRLAAVCDIDRPRAELFASLQAGVSVYTDWRELLRSERLDAVVLALPPEVSAPVAIECLQCGLAVLDEKPLAASLDEGRYLADKVRVCDRIYQVGFVLRYGDWVRRITELAPSLGTPQIICAEIYDERLDSTDTVHLNRVQSFLKNSSAMTHEGSHVIDYVSLWNSSPWTRVTASAQCTLSSFAGPNVWNAQVSLADNSILDLKVAWLLPKLPQSTISIEGPSGKLHFNCATGRGNYETDQARESFNLCPMRPEWDRQYDAFAAAIERGRVISATVDDALRTLEVTHACELSARDACPIYCSESSQGHGMHRIDPKQQVAQRKFSIAASIDRMPKGASGDSYEDQN
jgi:myo-inositol 2-dehydrogenase/D-chiro-inositol 1-dehydrogenase